MALYSLVFELPYLCVHVPACVRVCVCVCVCGNKLWWTRAVPSMVLTVMDHAPQPVDDRVHRWVVPPADLRRRESRETRSKRVCFSHPP